MAWTYTYDIATPADDDDPAEADDRMREIKAAVQERLAVEHVFDLTGSEVSDLDSGKHTDITCDSITNAGVSVLVGNVTVTGDFTLNTDKFTVDAATGNVVVAGTLGVTGIATLGDGSKLAAATETADGDRTIVDLNYVKTGDTVQHDAEGGYSNCDVNGVKTKVYTKYLTGNLDADATTLVAHGCTASKILHVSAIAYNDAISRYQVSEAHMEETATYVLRIEYDATNITFYETGSALRGNAYRIKIDYIL